MTAVSHGARCLCSTGEVDAADRQLCWARSVVASLLGPISDVLFATTDPVAGDAVARLDQVTVLTDEALRDLMGKFHAGPPSQALAASYALLVQLLLMINTEEKQ